jgi:peptidyl-prolyl cis-trans isomerase B (cyclophilin B)
VKDFVIQGGAPGGDPAKDVGDPVIGELPTDHYPVGSLAAAKTADAKAGTFDSQFFIVTGEQQGASLPNEYARFGGVSSGMDVVRKIEALTVDDNEQPNDEATIDKVTITES